jgi:hypothetical protein
MKQKENLLILFILIAIWFRLIPHLPNFTPITSLALFSGLMFKRRWLSITIPILAMILSDFVLGFSEITIWVYLGISAISIVSWFQRKININSILISSLVFFIISNFGVWVIGYPHTIDGLLTCFTLAIPFFGYSILGDLFWGYTFKYSYKLLESKILKVA